MFRDWSHLPTFAEVNEAIKVELRRKFALLYPLKSYHGLFISGQSHTHVLAEGGWSY